jgi:YD repeat-containing protein
VDNDRDQLIDCDDPDCCNTTACIDDDSCSSAPDPSDLVGNTTANTTFSFYDTIDFLFTSGLQMEVDLTAIDRARVAVVKGHVTTRDTTPVPGATVTVLGQPGFGYTLTRQDGSYDIACNGGGAVTLQYTRRNFIGAQRSITVPWNDYISVPDVAMIPVDNKVTEVDLSSGDDVKVAAGSPTEDEDGKRQGVLMFPPDTEALIVNRNGTGNTSVEKPMIRVTEYTVGSRGEEAMPAELPAFTGYTYAVEMSVDQATVNGSTEVVFNRPVSYFVENYLGFPVGSAVPAGFYNRTLGEWVAAPNGRVIQVLNVTVFGGKRLAVIDITGDGVAATAEELDDLGVTDKELQRIAAQYNVTQTLWRVPVRHFTPWDCNWPYGPPLDGCTPYQCNAQDKPISGPSKQLDPKDPYKITIGAVTITPETGVVSLKTSIPGSLFSLFYFSSRVPAYRPIIVIPLTAAILPSSLKRVHLKIRVRGREYVRLFPPQTELEYRFSWDGRDAYNRVVHGTVPCTVTIGYEYQLVYYSVGSQWRQSFNRISNADVNWQVRRGNRKVVFWEKRVTEIGTSDGPSEEVGLGGWFLNVHHSYDPGSGILQMGDGRKINFKDKSKVVTTVVGNGNTRPEHCTDCVAPSVQGTATSLRAAAVLATADDGSVFMGDYQLIRRYHTDGNVSTVVDLGNNPPSYSFYMAVSPLDGDLFISYAPLNQIIRIRAHLLSPGQPVVTLKDLGTRPGVTVFAGNGQLCRPWDFDCGDSGPAVDAKLTAPKGIAVGPRGTVYFIDGKLVRQVGGDGLINVFAGSRVPKGCAPPGCCVESTGNVPLDQAYFGWPTDLSLKSDDESLYVIDRNNVYHILREGQVRVAAGRAPHIPPQPSPVQQQQRDDFVPKPALQVDLKPLRGLAVSNSGTIFFAETDSSRTNRIRYVAQSGSMVTFAGSNPGCRCFAGDGEAASKAQFYIPSAVTLSPEEDILYIADQRNLRVRMVRVSLPRLSTAGFYAIPSPEGSSFFSFDFSGRHRFTVLTATSQVIHSFNYDDFGLLGSANGLLTKVTDAFNNTLRIERHADGRPIGFVSESGLKSTLTVDSDGYLSSLENNQGNPVKFAYHDSGGLLASRTSPSGLIQSFSYDDSGRLSKFRRSNGGVTQLSHIRKDSKFYAYVSGTSGHTTTVETSETGQVVTRPYGGVTVSTDLADGTRRVLYADGVTLEEDTTKDAVWGEQLSAVSKMKVTLPSGLTKTLDSTFYATFTQLLNPVALTKFGHSLRLNNKDWVKVDFDKLTLTKTIKSLESSETVKLTYRKSGLPLTLSAVNNGLSPITLSYDDNERVTSVSQGNVQLIYKFISTLVH